MPIWLRPHYAGGIWKGTLHSEKVIIFRPHYIGVATTTGHFGFVWGDHEQGNRTIILTLSFCKSFVCKMFPIHTITKNLKGAVLEKLRFRDGLVWTVGLTGKIRLRFEFLWRSVDVTLRSEHTRGLVAGTCFGDQYPSVYSYFASKF